MKHLVKIELGLIGFFLLAILIYVLWGGTSSKELVLICWMAIVALYLFGSYFLFKEKNSSKRILIPSILFGLMIAISIFSVIFGIFEWEGAREMMLIGLFNGQITLIVFGISLLIAGLSNNKQFYRNAGIRLLAWYVFLLGVWLIS
ncbi:MAG: hypothetical protein AAF587_00545 [Bacteroidota bacterium]